MRFNPRQWLAILGAAILLLPVAAPVRAQDVVPPKVNASTPGVGNVVAINVDENGIVSAVYDNSQIRQIAKVGLATFPNPDALQAVSGNAYRVSQTSGSYSLKAPGTAGAGMLSPSTLEASTVDLSAEFTGLITTQRAYSASSKIITTADQMLQELLDIKR